MLRERFPQAVGGRLAAALGALALLAGLLATGGAAPARAAVPPTFLDDCMEMDRVWVSVVTEDGEYLANRCIDPPDSGEEALTAADVETTHQSDGSICAMNAHPDPCPTSFNGQYWHYYQAAAGQDWQFAQVGPSDSTPQPGTIEAWCYNAEGTEQCTPPSQAEMADGPLTEVRSDTGEEDAGDQGGLPVTPIVIVIAAVVLVGIVVLALIRRRGTARGGDGPVGGR